MPRYSWEIVPRIDSSRAWACGAVGLLGAALAFLATSKYGISHHGDSARYISIARSLVQGQGFTLYDGRPEVWSAPLYPLILSMAAWLEADLLTFARYLHAIMYGLTLLLGARWFASLGVTKLAWATATCLMLFSTALFELATTALTDMLFVLLTTLSIILLDRFLLRPSMPQLLLAASCVGLAWLARFVGVTLAMVGAIVILLPRAAGWRERLRDSVIFGLVAAAPNALWLARNYLATGEAVATGATPTITFLGYFQSIVTVIGTWFLPPRIPEGARTALGFVIILCTTTVLVISVRKTLGNRVAADVGEWTAIRTAAFFVLTYIVFVNVTISLTFVTDRPDRYIVPAVIPIIGLLAVAAEKVLRNFVRRAPVLSRSLTFALLLVLVWPARHLVGWIQYSLRMGAGGYATDRWQRSQTLKYLRMQSPAIEFYTNERSVIYFYGGGSRARFLPPHGLPGEPADPISALESFRDSLRAETTALVVLFEPNPPSLEAYSYTRKELEEVFDVSLIASFEDGSLYSIGPRVPSDRMSGRSR